MGFLDIFRPRHEADAERVAASPSFKTITEYSPAFSTPSGAAYENLLIRAAIEKTSVLASKLKPEVLGTSKPRIRRAIETAPNQYMSWPKMIGRVVTIALADNTAAVVPSIDQSGAITGLFPLKFEWAEVVDYGGEPWVRFYLGDGDVMAIELANVCFITRFQYESDLFGSSNDALKPTLGLMAYQDQAQELAIKNGAKIQFIAATSSSMRPEDIRKKREQFSEDNLSSKNTSGLMVYDNTFDNVKQVEPMSYTVSTDEMDRIEQNVYSYFGINADILHSDYSEEQFGAFYESQIEPLAVQLGEGLTQMLYTPVERMHGNRIMFSANRLEYASNASKRNMVRDMMDRCVMTLNEAREVLQLPPVEGGDVFIARGEYYMLDSGLNLIYASGGQPSEGGRGMPADGSIAEKDFDLGGDDDIYNDTDGRGEKEVDE